jgi:prevent-host-death family protein
MISMGTPVGTESLIVDKSLINIVLYLTMYNKSEVTHMQRLKIDQDIRTMSEFRSGVASFLKQVRDTGRPMVITQHGKGVAVLLDVGEYEAMQEKIELLQDIQTSMGQLAAGAGIGHNDAKSAVLKRVAK